MGYEQLEEISDMTTFIEKKKGIGIRACRDSQWFSH
jgi:hypothetical protein